MGLALLMALQSAALAPPPPPALVSDFDLATFRPSGDAADGRGCVGRDPSEIVVCGRRRRGGAYPFAEMERKFAVGPIVAEAGIGGGATGRAYVEGVEIGPGMRSNRLMVGIKLPF
ncbi:MAG TPA: hypothetical protein VF662_07395 [Allosphingosinicella sp.]|jgi:hypothetical protein